MPSEDARTTTVDAIALLPLPDLDGLSEQQVRGAACVWTGVILTPETAVDLGPRTVSRAGVPVPWFPRATRLAVHQAAHLEILDHSSRCEQCVDDFYQCAVGVGLWRLARKYRW